jgi:hypothetical protein
MQLLFRFDWIAAIGVESITQRRLVSFGGKKTSNNCVCDIVISNR